MQMISYLVQQMIICKELFTTMQVEFEISIVGEMNFFLGFQVKQLKEGIFITQTKYIKDLLTKYNLSDVKITYSPMSTSIKINKDEDGKYVDKKLYRGMIGSLLYFTTSKLYILFSVG